MVLFVNNQGKKRTINKLIYWDCEKCCVSKMFIIIIITSMWQTSHCPVTKSWKCGKDEIGSTKIRVSQKKILLYLVILKDKKKRYHVNDDVHMWIKL